MAAWAVGPGSVPFALSRVCCFQVFSQKRMGLLRKIGVRFAILPEANTDRNPFCTDIAAFADATVAYVQGFALAQSDQYVSGDAFVDREDL